MPRPTNARREFEVVVFGATGFTGRLVAAHLLEHHAAVRWAIAGRDRAKLETVRSKLGAAAERLSLVVADAHDRPALDSLCGRTKVVATTAGPFSRYGAGLVAACAAHGTHYCDLAGEVPWIRSMIDAHETNARASGACIVPSCGFDSIPSDLGTAFLQREAVARFGEPCREIHLRVMKLRGTASGGTVASMMLLVEQATKDRDTRRLLLDPYALNPHDQRSGPDLPDLTGWRYDNDLETYIAPFLMAGINTRIVRRSHALMGTPWGTDFRYEEAVAAGAGTAGWSRAASITLGLGSLTAGIALPPVRALLKRFVLPKPGEGPNAQQRERGMYDLLLLGQLADGRRLRARVTGDRDPGYGSTAKMFAESAVCLASDPLSVGGGFWTPATAMGPKLQQRLEARAGISFEIVDTSPTKKSP